MLFIAVMTLRHFRTLSENEQFAIIESEGIFLQEREDGYYNIRLYAFENFYIELYCHSHFNVIVRTKCFAGTKGLEPYLDAIDINDIL